MSEKKPLSEAQRRARKKWNDANLKKRYDQILLIVPKGRKKDIGSHAAARGESVNGMINRLLRTDMGRTEEDWKKIEADSRETD